MLKKVIVQLNKEQYNHFQNELNNNRGEKFVRLLELFRDTQLDENEICKEIKINQSAYYTLKSRLFDKLQEYLFRSASDDRAELLKNISSIPHLVYHTPRETAISLLIHLETELKKLDMPHELIGVYNALKKLHINTEKYYQYQQHYNKTVAYSLAVDKADELVSSFNRELGEYTISCDEKKLALLQLYLKEFRNLNKLYDSHRLKVSLCIASISYALFAVNGAEIPEMEETTEELLKQMHTILESHPEDRQYKFLKSIWHFLNFEYYKSLRLYKNCSASFEKVNADLETFLLLAHSCDTSRFLISKIDYAIRTNTADKLHEEFKSLIFEPDPLNATEFTFYSIYAASCCFHSGLYSEGAVFLNRCVNEISFKNYSFAEIQVKLFLSSLLLLAGKTEQAEIIIRSISRKLAGEEFTTQFQNAVSFSKFLKTALNDNSNGKQKKLEQAYSAFTKTNEEAEHSILKFVPLSTQHFELLSR